MQLRWPLLAADTATMHPACLRLGAAAAVAARAVGTRALLCALLSLPLPIASPTCACARAASTGTGRDDRRSHGEGQGAARNEPQADVFGRLARTRAGAPCHRCVERPDRSHGPLQPAPSVCAPMRSAGEADSSKSRSALRCGLVVLPVALSHAAVPSARTRLHAPRNVPCAGMGAIPCR